MDLDRAFDGILSWNGFFHLSPQEQRVALPRIADHLNPGGPLLLTIGPEAGEVMGAVAGECVYHASLAPSEYAAILHSCDVSVIAFAAKDTDCGDHSILLARKQP